MNKSKYTIADMMRLKAKAAAALEELDYGRVRVFVLPEESDTVAVIINPVSRAAKGSRSSWPAMITPIDITHEELLSGLRKLIDDMEGIQRLMPDAVSRRLVGNFPTAK